VLTASVVLLGVKILDGSVTGFFTGPAEGIEWVVETEADVLDTGLSSGSQTNAMEDALGTHPDGVVSVTAASDPRSCSDCVGYL
jgi:hypothetical protein